MPNSNEMTEAVILKLLSERSMYGYEIIKVVLERTGGAFEWKEGTLYPCLHRLEQSGLIESSWEFVGGAKPRKYYHLTRDGAATYAERAEETKMFCANLTLLLS